MHRAPYYVAAAVFSSCIATAIHLAGGPRPFSAGSGVVLGIGFLLFAVIGVAGLLLSRGRWSRRLTTGLVMASLAAAALTDPWSPAAVAATILGGLALIGVSGRWLDAWIRRLPTPDGPGVIVMTLVLGLLGLVPAVALAAPTDISASHGILGAAGVLYAWAYSRAEVWALWATRTTLPLLAVPGLFASPPPGAIFLAVVVIALTALAWRRESLLAVQPLMDRLPGPRVLGEGGKG